MNHRVEDRAPQVRFLLDIVTRMESKCLLSLGRYAHWGLESQPVLPRSTYWDWAQASIYTHVSLLKKKCFLHVGHTGILSISSAQNLISYIYGFTYVVACWV